MLDLKLASFPCSVWKLQRPQFVNENLSISQSIYKMYSYF